MRWLMVERKPLRSLHRSTTQEQGQRRLLQVRLLRARLLRLRLLLRMLGRRACSMQRQPARLLQALRLRQLQLSLRLRRRLLLG